MAGAVHIPWYATGFRGDAFEEAIQGIAEISLRYGATSYSVYRYREDRYKFLQVAQFESYSDWERYWEGDDFIDFRARYGGWYQVPVLYAWTDLIAHDEVAPQTTTAGRGSGGPQGDTI